MKVVFVIDRSQDWQSALAGSRVACDRWYLIEVNDNPNIDAGNEDQVLGGALYRKIMGVYARRIGERRRVARR